MWWIKRHIFAFIFPQKAHFSEVIFEEVLTKKVYKMAEKLKNHFNFTCYFHHFCDLKAYWSGVYLHQIPVVSEIWFCYWTYSLGKCLKGSSTNASLLTNDSCSICLAVLYLESVEMGGKMQVHRAIWCRI